MLPTSLTQPLRRLWTLEPFAYSLRVFIALAGAMANFAPRTNSLVSLYFSLLGDFYTCLRVERVGLSK